MKKLIVILFVFVGILGYSQKLYTTNPTIKVELSISKLPVKNEVFQVTSIITPVIDLPDTSKVVSKIILPDGAELISGDLNVKIKLLKEDSFSHNITVRFTDTGNFMIEAKAGSIDFGGGRDGIPLYIGKRKSQFGYKLPKNFPESKIEQ